MKKSFALLSLILVFTILLGGCDLEEDAPRKKKKPVTEPSASVSAEQTELPATLPPQTEPPTEPTEPLSTSFPYTLKVPAEACVFKEPNRDSQFVQTIGADGTYTIVAEERDLQGDRWGRLKSGIGWVNLSNFFCEGSQLPPITISRSGELLLSRPHQLINVHSTYVRKISLMTHQHVTNLRVVFTNHGEQQETVYACTTLNPTMPLVLALNFEGDFFGYDIEYTDSNGNFHSHSICESGLDGSLVVDY